MYANRRDLRRLRSILDRNTSSDEAYYNFNCANIRNRFWSLNSGWLGQFTLRHLIISLISIGSEFYLDFIINTWKPDDILNRLWFKIAYESPRWFRILLVVSCGGINTTRSTWVVSRMLLYMYRIKYISMYTHECVKHTFVCRLN